MRMAVSYVLVTAAAVILVDGVVLGVLLPGMLASSYHASKAAGVAQQAGADAKQLSVAAAILSAHLPPGTASTQLLKQLATGRETPALGLAATGHASAQSGKRCLEARSAEVLILPDGTVLASSNPVACPRGTRLGFAARPGLDSQGSAGTARGTVVWAVSPVIKASLAELAGALAGGQSPSPAVSGPGTPSPAGRSLAPVQGSPAPVVSSPAPAGSSPAREPSAKRVPAPGVVLGGVYVEAPAGTAFPVAQVRQLLVTGGLVLALVIPVGTVFGLLSTRRVIRRITRLAEVTATVAGGDFRPRVPVSGDDEIGQLEDAFNRMAGQLSEAVDAERLRAGADARQAERARIARELHDSISQDLFSLSLLAAGLRKALRGSPELRPELAAMERTAARAMREMQALLLELRPVALEDVGLVPAIAELCQAYQARLGIQVSTELGEVALDPVAEHAVLRVVQEALGNAARHGQPDTILVRLGQQDGTVTLEVRDDGRGFDPQAVGERHGMGLALMRERVAELGGDLRLDAAPGHGAAFLVRLPVSQDGQP
jgi:signal transduction histidine kinase